MTLANRLSALDFTTPPPTWAELEAEGESNLVGQVAELDATLLREAAELMVVSWADLDLDVRCDLAAVLGRRLHEIHEPLSFASAIDVTIAACLACGSNLPATQAAASLLAAVQRALSDGHEADAVRARPALGGLCDLVAADRIAPYQLLALMEQLAGRLPEPLASPAARAAGRMAELRDEPIFELLIAAAMRHPDALADASVEAGHLELRQAFVAPDADRAVQALKRARHLYIDADTADLGRPDALAFTAAIDLLLAYYAGADVEALAEPASRLHKAVSEFSRYDTDEQGPSRPAVLTASWWTFAAQLRGAAETLDGRDNLDLRKGLLALLDVYAGARVRVVAEDDPGLQTVLRPPVERWIAKNLLAREALSELVQELPPGSESRLAAERILEVTRGNPGKAQRSRSQPGLLGGWALGTY